MLITVPELLVVEAPHPQPEVGHVAEEVAVEVAVEALQEGQEDPAHTTGQPRTGWQLVPQGPKGLLAAPLSQDSPESTIPSPQAGFFAVGATLVWSILVIVSSITLLSCFQEAVTTNRSTESSEGAASTIEGLNTSRIAWGQHRFHDVVLSRGN